MVRDFSVKPALLSCIGGSISPLIMEISAAPDFPMRNIVQVRYTPATSICRVYTARTTAATIQLLESSMRHNLVPQTAFCIRYWNGSHRRKCRLQQNSAPLNLHFEDLFTRREVGMWYIATKNFFTVNKIGYAK